MSNNIFEVLANTNKKSSNSKRNEENQRDHLCSNYHFGNFSNEDIPINVKDGEGFQKRKKKHSNKGEIIS